MNLHRISTLIISGVVAAAVAAPLGQAAAADRVQVAGSFVAPAQVSEAQLKAGHDPATRFVQIGGGLVAPSQLSAYENALGGTASTGSSGDSSSGIGTGGIAGAAVLGVLVLLSAASALVFRHRRRLVTA
jgi:hypothetical protein